MIRHTVSPVLLLYLALGLYSCEVTLEMPEKAGTKLTIVSHLAAGSWEKQRVMVYASKPASASGAFTQPAGAGVSVTELESSKTIQLESVTDDAERFFVFPEGFLQVGRGYAIEAAAPGFDTVRSVTHIPRPSTVSGFTVRDVSVEPSEKNEAKDILRYKVSFEIRHLAPNRYYHLIFLNQYEGMEDILLVAEPEPSDDHPFLHHYDFGVLIDKDNLVIGRPLTFSFLDWVVEGNELKKVYFELRTVTEEYYRYHTTLARQLIVRKDPFAEPVSIFNNIEDGFGNFSGFSSYILSAAVPY